MGAFCHHYCWPEFRCNETQTKAAPFGLSSVVCPARLGQARLGPLRLTVSITGAQNSLLMLVVGEEPTRSSGLGALQFDWTAVSLATLASSRIGAAEAAGLASEVIRHCASEPGR